MLIYFCTSLILIAIGVNLGVWIAGPDNNLVEIITHLGSLLAFISDSFLMSILTGCLSGYLIYRYQTFRSIKIELTQSLYRFDVFFTLKDGFETNTLEPASQQQLFDFYKLAHFKEGMLRAQGFGKAAKQMAWINLGAAEYVAYKNYENIQNWREESLLRIDNLQINFSELLGMSK